MPGQKRGFDEALGEGAGSEAVGNAAAAAASASHQGDAAGNEKKARTASTFTRTFASGAFLFAVERMNTTHSLFF
jgi:hypothetical protein